jgi:hypothetical protein
LAQIFGATTERVPTYFPGAFGQGQSLGPYDISSSLNRIGVPPSFTFPQKVRDYALTMPATHLSLGRIRLCDNSPVKERGLKEKTPGYAKSPVGKRSMRLEKLRGME